jgi:hypothetical protein
MGVEYTDPWATQEPGFEQYAGPAAADGFDPLDTQTVDLGTFLRAEAQKVAAQSPRQTVETVTLPNGTRGQLTEKAFNNWELLIHLGRDYYRVLNARTRAGVLEAADEFHR